MLIAPGLEDGENREAWIVAADSPFRHATRCRYRPPLGVGLAKKKSPALGSAGLGGNAMP